MSEFFKVDGLRCNTEAEARTLANTLYKRYDETRTITVIKVDEEVGYEIDIITLESAHNIKLQCEFTKDLFG
jgi:hypothetical protein